MNIRENTSPRFPFQPFPDSWYAVAWSSEVPAGTAVPIRALGRDLVAFRTSDGTVSLLDAHCPHLGAHLGHGGKVINDELQCPFHGWRFGSDGRCTAASGNKRPRDGSTLLRWPTQEMHGRIWVWFSNSGAVPTWNLPTVLLDPGLPWAPAGRIDRTFSSHPQDILENAVDPHHFLFIHGMSSVRDADVSYDEHCITTRLYAHSSSDRLGVKGFVFEGWITVRVYGMGLQTIHTAMGMELAGVKIEVNTLVVEGITPREAGTASILVDIHAVRTLPRGMMWLARRAFHHAVKLDVDADIQVWANRRYLTRPQLTSADGEIARYRKWARRFYPSPGDDSR
jgi:nitrite reductase/ring-hydroxylating ferredoxin subunit